MHTALITAVALDDGENFKVTTCCTCEADASIMKVPMHHLAQLTSALNRLCEMEGIEVPRATDVPPEVAIGSDEALRQAQVWLDQQRAAAAGDGDGEPQREAPSAGDGPAKAGPE